MYLMRSYHITLLPISYISPMRWRFIWLNSPPLHIMEVSRSVESFTFYLASCLPISILSTLVAFISWWFGEKMSQIFVLTNFKQGFLTIGEIFRGKRVVKMKIEWESYGGQSLIIVKFNLSHTRVCTHTRMTEPYNLDHWKCMMESQLLDGQ